MAQPPRGTIDMQHMACPVHEAVGPSDGQFFQDKGTGWLHDRQTLIKLEQQVRLCAPLHRWLKSLHVEPAPCLAQYGIGIANTRHRLR